MRLPVEPRSIRTGSSFYHDCQALASQRIFEGN